MKVQTLGRFAVSDGERDRTPTAMPAQVLKLVVCAGGALHGEQVVDTLWSYRSAEEGRSRLRKVLSRLRAQCGPVLTRRDQLLVLAPGVQVDFAEFEDLAGRALNPAGELPREHALELARAALQCYRGDLLPEDRYAEWTQDLRERLRRRYVAVLHLVVEDARAAGELETALLLVDRAMAFQPDAEDIALEAVEILLLLGRRAAALRLLEQSRDHLAAIGLPPSARWRALHARAREAGEPPATRGA